jgi:hypothetical protein
VNAILEAALWVTAIMGFGLFVVFSLLLGRWLLEPVNRAAGHLNAPTQFLLTDFMWLMIQLQLLLGFVMNWIEGATSTGWLFVVIVGLCVPLAIMWAASVSVVSRAGITQPLRRAVLILVLVPGSLALIIAGPVILVTAITAIANAPYDRPARWLAGLAGIVLAAVVSVVMAFVIRRLSFWVLSRDVALVPPDTQEAAETSPNAAG